MDKIRALVTGVGGAAGVGVVQSLREKNIFTLGVNCFALTAGFKLTHDFAVVPLAREENFIPVLLDLCKAKKINVLIPTVDEELILCARNREQFQRIGVKVALGEAETIAKCLDKWIFFQELKRYDLPVAQTWSARGECSVSKLNFPLIAKPRMGRGGRGIRIFHGPEGLGDFLALGGDYILQEYVEGEEFSVDTLADFYGQGLVAVPRKRIEVKGGVCWKGCTVHNEQISVAALEISEKLGLKGPACMQLKVSKAGEIKFFEINPRMGGTTSLTRAAGVDIPYLTVKLLMEGTVDPAELRFRKTYISRYFADVFFTEDELPQDVEGELGLL